jgi:hypothetical protein
LIKGIQNVFKSPFFVSMATAAKFVLSTPIFLAYLVPLDVDVTGNITAKRSEVWSEFNIFCTLVTMVKLCRNIYRSVWQLLGGRKNSKWQPLPW